MSEPSATGYAPVNGMQLYFGDDIAGVAEHLGLDRIDLFGYSLGAGAASFLQGSDG